ncbi:MAG: hypothetical protein QM817_37460 [Archangium sp.]
MFELFHAISDAQSARVRKYIVDHDLVAQIKFRNVAYDEPKKDLSDRGGKAAPALWDGHVLISGADAIIAKLSTVHST